jgi:polyisoprenoid-binding protein YceI
MPRLLSRRALPARTSAAVLASLCIALTGAQAQARWTIDPRTSLAWWQVSPHLNHLWATTCPEEPSWRPGQGRSSGWSMATAVQNASRTGYQNVPDTVHVPLYPRSEIHRVCPADAVTGQLVLPDTVTWRGAHGEVAVKAEALTTGEDMRDVYARNAILGVFLYPVIRFELDSLVHVTRHGDTLRGTAMGALTIRRTTNPVSAAVTAFPVGDSTRVLAKIRMPARALVSEWNISKHALGLGVGTNIWKDFFMGVDLMVGPEAIKAHHRTPQSGAS